MSAVKSPALERQSGGSKSNQHDGSLFPFGLTTTTTTTASTAAAGTTQQRPYEIIDLTVAAAAAARPASVVFDECMFDILSDSDSDDDVVFVGKTDPNERYDAQQQLQLATTKQAVVVLIIQDDDDDDGDVPGKSHAFRSSLARAVEETRQSKANTPSSLARAVEETRRRKTTQSLALASTCATAHDDDWKYAMELQEKERKSMTLEEQAKKQKEENDRVLAETMQAQFANDSKEQESQEMLKTNCGKAYIFVQNLLNHIKTMQGQIGAASGAPAISTLATDDLLWLVERMLVKQEEYKSANLCTVVDLGFHYTKQENLDRIRTNGLLSSQERVARKIQTTFNGAVYGDGIYTCNNPTTYRGHQYGPVGLLVARLKGKTASVVSNDITYVKDPLVVLRSSSQCVPLMQFIGEPGTVIPQCQLDLLSLVDSFFNADAVMNTKPIVVDAQTTFGVTFGISPSATASSSTASTFAMGSSTTASLSTYTFNAPATSASTIGSATTFSMGISPPQGSLKSLVRRRSTRLIAAQSPLSSPVPFARPSLPGAKLAATASRRSNISQAATIHSQSVNWLTGPTAPAYGNLSNTQYAGGPAPTGVTPPFGLTPATGSGSVTTTTTFASTGAPFGMSPFTYANPSGTAATLPVSAFLPSRIGSKSGPFGSATPGTWGPHVRVCPSLFGSPSIPTANNFGTTGGSSAHGLQSAGNAVLSKTIHYHAPEKLNHDAMAKIFKDLTSRVNADDECAICLDSLASQERGKIVVCGHMFHYNCIVAATAQKSRCPLCSKDLSDPQGTMPSGTLFVTSMPSVVCSGYYGGSIELRYSIPRGIQKSYHSNPGRVFSGSTRLAYLPDNDQGRDLLKRLEYAFVHGLTFTVGTSLTSGMTDSVTWASIHHKTSPSGGAHGFPDAKFFDNCNAELGALGVPLANEL